MPYRAQIAATVLTPPPEPEPENFGVQLAADLPNRSRLAGLLALLMMLATML